MTKNKQWLFVDVLWWFIFFSVYVYYNGWANQYVRAQQDSLLFQDSVIPRSWRLWVLWQTYSIPAKFLLWFFLGLVVRRLPILVIGVIFAVCDVSEASIHLVVLHRSWWPTHQAILGTLLNIVAIIGGTFLGICIQKWLLRWWATKKGPTACSHCGESRNS